eukprot:12908474-Heterocapsa_arctica.AAC.1
MLETSAGLKPADGEREPGGLPVISGVVQPMAVSMPARPCLISVWRRRAKSSVLPSAVKPAGSQKPTSACSVWGQRGSEEVSTLRWPGSVPVISGVVQPMAASRPVGPCLISVWRRRARLPSA